MIQHYADPSCSAPIPAPDSIVAWGNRRSIEFESVSSAQLSISSSSGRIVMIRSMPPLSSWRVVATLGRLPSSTGSNLPLRPGTRLLPRRACGRLIKALGSWLLIGNLYQHSTLVSSLWLLTNMASSHSDILLLQNVNQATKKKSFNYFSIIQSSRLLSAAGLKKKEFKRKEGNKKTLLAYCKWDGIRLLVGGF